jgi:hypothetical protein
MLRYLLFWDVTKRRLVLTDVSKQPRTHLQESSSPRTHLYNKVCSIKIILLIGLLYPTETPIIDDQYTLRNITEKRTSHLHRG